MTSDLDESELRHWPVDYVVTNIGCSRNDVNFETSLKNVGGSFLADVHAFDAEFVATSPIKEIWSKGLVGV